MILKHRYAPLIFGVLAISAIAGYMALFKSSPGDLSSPHAAVAGSSFVGDCRKCHDPKGLAAGCESCHKEIAWQLDKKLGYHGKALAGKASECGKCHSEHNGAEFALVNKVSWGGEEPKTFPHDFVDYTLKGKHAPLACMDCHHKKAPHFALPDFPQTARRQTYLGLKQDCFSCHADPHAGGRVTDCLKCHDQNGWKPAPGFNHDRFFVLADKHVGVSCAKCHAGAPAEGKVFGPVKGTRCADCHANPHKTDWKLACASCHTERAVAWALASSKMTKAQHAQTSFKLVKPHDRVSCAKCHAPEKTYAQRFAKIPERSCESCHKDPHAGQFLAKHARCADCHSAQAFKPSTFGVKEHASSYPLTGGHAPAPCAACHVKDPKLGGAARFAGAPRDCASCHKDPHVGQFRSASGAVRCEDCHLDPSSWKKLVFDHDRARFKLDAAHKGVACKECHPSVALKDGRRVIQYKPINSACADCHDFKR